MQVKLIDEFLYSNLEKEINEFIKDKKVIDIKTIGKFNDNILIMYEEKENGN